MSDVQEHFYILVGDGPLVGPFVSEASAEVWAKQQGFAYKWIDRVEDWHVFTPEKEQKKH
jgi:hypothetical protein